MLHLPGAFDHDFLPVFLAADKPRIKLCGDPSTAREQRITRTERCICVGPNPPNLDPTGPERIRGPTVRMCPRKRVALKRSVLPLSAEVLEQL